MVAGKESIVINPFLPRDEELAPRYDVPKDVEDATKLEDSKQFDPFRDRDVDHPTSDFNTLTHLLKATFGSGLLYMPSAFVSSGVVVGIFGVIFVACICTHTAYILVKCAHILYYRTHKTKFDYPDVIETAFATGPKCSHKFSKFARRFLEVWLFSTYFGACSTDNLLIATNFGQLINYYKNESIGAAINTDAGDVIPVDDNLKRIIMVCLLVPIILFVWVPDLKYLAPISTIANIFMASVIGMTFYYFLQKPISEMQLTQPIEEFPKFFATTIFAMQNIGVMMPLENNMKKPQHFLGTCGILNKGMFGITCIQILVGVFGYRKYGSKAYTIITVNFPVTEIIAQIAKGLFGLTVLLSFSLNFYVCHKMVWDKVKNYFPNRPLIAEYTIRAVLVIVCVSIAIAVPTIRPLINLLGAFGFSVIGIIIPVIIETVTHWETGFGRFNWMIYKNIFLILIGIIALIFGSFFAIQDIVKEMLT